LLVQPLDDRTHPVDETRCDAHEKSRGVFRPGVLREHLPNVLDRHQAPSSQADHAVRVDPHSDRHHVLGIGLGVEAHPSQDDDQSVAAGDTPGSGFLGKQRLARQRVQA